MANKAAMAAASVSGLWRSISGGDAPPPGYDAKSTSLATGFVHLPTKSGALDALKIELQNLVLNGLRTTKNPEEWFAYWENSHLTTFGRLNNALASLVDAAYETEHERQQLIERGNAACRDAIARVLPHLARDVDEAEKQIRTAGEIVAPFRALPTPMLRAVDMDCGRRVGGAMWWFGIVMNSLVVACEHYQDPNPAMIDFLRTLAGVTSKLALSAARAAANLRRVPADEQLILHAVIEPADDGLGMVASIKELDLETCGETRGEMHALLASAVAGYFNAEKQRGTLSDRLSELLGTKGPSLPNGLVVSLYIQDDEDVALSDVMKLEI